METLQHFAIKHSDPPSEKVSVMVQIDGGGAVIEIYRGMSAVQLISELRKMAFRLEAGMNARSLRSKR